VSSCWLVSTGQLIWLEISLAEDAAASPQLAQRVRDGLGEHGTVRTAGPDPWSMVLTVEDPDLVEPLEWTFAAYTWDAVESALERGMARLRRDRQAVLRRRPLTARTRGAAVVCAESAGVLMHECVAHSSEADNFVSYGSRLGITLGGLWSRLPLDVVDDPSLFPWMGSYGRDDEETVGRPVELVRGGRWAGLLSNRSTAALTGDVSTGHGRGSPPRTPRGSVLTVGAGSLSEVELLGLVGDGWLLGTPTAGFSVGEFVELRYSWAWSIRHGAMEPRAEAGVVGPLLVRAKKVSLVRQIIGIGSEQVVNSPLYPCVKDGVEVACTFISPALALRDLVIEPAS